jgi:iron(III) transport system substrate-binding protein
MQTIHPLNQVRRLCSIGSVSLPVLSDAVFTQAKSASPADIYLCKEADRQYRLMAGARKEGTISIYTWLNLKDSQAITEAFEKNTASRFLRRPTGVQRQSSEPSWDIEG